MNEALSLRNVIANVFTNSSGRLLIDALIMNYLQCVLENTLDTDADSISRATQTIAPVIHNCRVTATLEEAEEIVANLVCEVCSLVSAHGRDSAVSLRLDDAVSVSQQVQQAVATTEYWKDIQTARDLGMQKLQFQMMKSTEKARALAEKRRAKGKHSTKEEASAPDKDVNVSQTKFVPRTVQAIRLDKVTLAYGKNVLLEDCDFTFHFGRRYSLIGRNGTGKSSLLRAIAHGEITCLASKEQYKMLYVSQEVAPSMDRVIDVVLSANDDYVRLTTAERAIKAAIDLLEEHLMRLHSASHRASSVKSENPASRTLESLLPEHVLAELNDSTFSSMGASPSTVLDTPTTEALLDGLGVALQQRYDEMEAADIFNAQARASQILAGLQFTPAMQIRRTKEFSGGWLMRVSLAKALFVAPDILFLDEPDNHLDTDAIMWLENWLVNFPQDKLVIVVSHDTDFLNQFTTDIVFLNNKKLTKYSGNYDTFIEVRENELKNQQKQAEKQEALQAHVQTFIDKFRHNAVRASLVQSRIKMLNKMEKLFVSEDRAVPPFVFPGPEESGAQFELLSLKDVEFSYVQQKLERFCLKDINLTVYNDSRIALCGANGSGKSTILKLLSGMEKPDSGVFIRNNKCIPAVFWQHHTDLLDLDKTPLQTISDFAPGETNNKYMAHLGAFGITGDLVFQTNRTLSGGQRSRLNFALLTFQSLPSLLILDEPTNHLDIETRLALAEGLNQYTGAVILVSHDAQMIQSVTDELYVVKAGTMTKFNGSFLDYKEHLRGNVK